MTQKPAISAQLGDFDIAIVLPESLTRLPFTPYVQAVSDCKVCTYLGISNSDTTNTNGGDGILDLRKLFSPLFQIGCRDHFHRGIS